MGWPVQGQGGKGSLQCTWGVVIIALKIGVWLEWAGLALWSWRGREGVLERDRSVEGGLVCGVIPCADADVWLACLLMVDEPGGVGEGKVVICKGMGGLSSFDLIAGELLMNRVHVLAYDRVECSGEYQI